MAELAIPTTSSNSSATPDAVAPAQTADSSAQLGVRSDTASQQVQAQPRDVNFNPASEAAAAAPASGTATGQPAASGVSNEYTGVLDYARGRGLDVTGYDNDAALMDAMTDRFHRGQQEDYYAQLGRALAPRAAEIQNYLGNANQPAKPAAAAAPAEWERPQMDQRWVGMVDRDPLSGMYLGKPGTPPAITEAVNRYAQWQEKYGSDPLSAVRPYVEQQLPQVIQQQVSAALQQYQTAQATQQILATNAEWMYAHDEAGRPTIGVGGQRVFTAQGKRYGQYVQHLESQGMRDPTTVDRYARQLVMADVNAGIAAQYAGQQPAPVQTRQAIAAGRPQVNQLQSLTPRQRAVTPGATEPNQEGMSLHDRLTHAIKVNGFTDADFDNFSPD